MDTCRSQEHEKVGLEKVPYIEGRGAQTLVYPRGSHNRQTGVHDMGRSENLKEIGRQQERARFPSMYEEKDKVTGMSLSDEEKRPLRCKTAARVVAALYIDPSYGGYATIEQQYEEFSKIAVAQADSLIKELEK